MINWNDSGSTVIKATLDQVEKEKIGYTLLKQDVIKCGNCNKPLVSVIMVQNNDDRHAIKAYCPYCKDCSFWYQITGKICIQAVEGLSMIDMPTNIRNGINFTEIKVAKNG